MNAVSPELDLDRDVGDVPAWKAELQEKLAASRARRGGRPLAQTQTGGGTEPNNGTGATRTASVAAAVAARYAQAPSYRELLADEAQAAAEAAATAAREAHMAAEEVVARLQAARHAEHWAAAAGSSEDELDRAALEREAEREREAAQPARVERDQLAVRMDLDPRTQQHLNALEARLSARESLPERQEFVPLQPRLADPLEEELVSPATPLAANLIEFPRELVAPRKARPRTAEGPLREEMSEDGQGSLRIFEAAPETGSEIAESFLPDAPHAPGWTTAIRLDASPAAPARRHAHPNGLELPLKTASLEDRLMGALVDGALVMIGFLLFVLAFYATAAHPPAGKGAIAGAAVAFLALSILYQALFFTFGESTPGMRYAHIALCTFDDTNPTRKAMRRRVGALLLASFPAGLGLLWAIFDEDRLGWHDRISGTYQRSYR